MIKVSIHQDDITITNIYVPRNRALKIHEAKTDITYGRNRQFNSNSWRLQYPTFNNGQNNQGEDQQEIIRLELHYTQIRLTDI